MKQLIDEFPSQIEESLEIGSSYVFKTPKKSFSNLVICGLGGSGIGASFFLDATIHEIAIPVVVVKGYDLPKFANENTLVIAVSYSGNTEETVSCFEEALSKSCTLIGISSNGRLKELCLQNSIDFIEIPGGRPPRASLAYSTVQIFYVAAYFGLIANHFEQDFVKAKQRIESENAELEALGKDLAAQLFDKIPVLYSANGTESLTVRWRQQINENGKQLAWHNVVPEMNHNELVGWRQENQNLGVVFLRNDNDHPSVQKRMDLNKIVYANYTNTIFEIWSKGDSFIERSLYLIQIGDYLSYYLSVERGFNVTEVQVIDDLKAALKNV